jgi:hypothetical protein
MAPTNAQTLASVRILLLVFLTWLGNHGYSNAKDLATFTDPAVIEAFVSLIGLVATAAWGVLSWRPHGVIKSANSLEQVDAVVVKPKTASEINTPGVVSSLTGVGPSSASTN